MDMHRRSIDRLLFLGYYPYFIIIYNFYHIEKCRKYSTGVFLGRKLSYFSPADGSGKKNSQTQISNFKFKKFTNPNRFAKNLTNFQNYVIL